MSVPYCSSERAFRSVPSADGDMNNMESPDQKFLLDRPRMILLVLEKSLAKLPPKPKPELLQDIWQHDFFHALAKCRGIPYPDPKAPHLSQDMGASKNQGRLIDPK